ncbi:RteC domain-containing protein [Chryseobacterium manosquense]|uniref:RteC domain-containing protein n=1 Tax=Chryseobacterium manosquense TaxID=2754694 RepID=A0A7H1E0C9_9FLAO|nr:RteC domain-containing protein [Chryseobacterium manosquense]QNS42687.1 RteC domain-containing protein [Chryseobacterium manosquense]
MHKFYKDKLRELDNRLEELKVEFDEPIQLAETAVNLILSYLKDIKLYVVGKGFDEEKDEIIFFKKLKPNIVAKLIFYNAIYKIETRKPYGSGKNIKKYIDIELNKLKRFFDNNLEFYKYYRTNSTYLDHKYFLRGKYDIKLSLDTFYFEADHSFSTSHDYKVAKIIANDLIQVYLEDQLNLGHQKNGYDRSSLNWTESKTALTELIYALHSQGAFGNSDIVAIAKTFESTFNISLGDFYHTFMELKSRKINRTKFLDSLRDALIRKMEEQEEM